MSRWTKPRSYSLKVPWPLAGCVDAGLGRRFSPSALRMRQMLSRLRCGHEMGDDKRQVIKREVGNATQHADNGALLLGCLPGQLVWPGRVVQAVCTTALAPLADGFGGDAIALGEDAAALMGAGDLGTGNGCGAGVRMDLQHRSDLPLSGLDQAFEQVAIPGNSMPHRIPTMLRDLTTKSGQNLNVSRILR